MIERRLGKRIRPGIDERESIGLVRGTIGN
jgi:hypothetical protein